MDAKSWEKYNKELSLKLNNIEDNLKKEAKKKAFCKECNVFLNYGNWSDEVSLCRRCLIKKRKVQA